LPATRVLLITASSGRTTIRTVGCLSEFRAHPSPDRNDIRRLQFDCFPFCGGTLVSETKLADYGDSLPYVSQQLRLLCGVPLHPRLGAGFAGCQKAGRAGARASRSIPASPAGGRWRGPARSGSSPPRRPASREEPQNRRSARATAPPSSTRHPRPRAAPECSTMASEEPLTSPATIGLSAMYPAAANRCGSSTTAPKRPRNRWPVHRNRCIARGIVPARLGKDRPRPTRLRRRTPSGRDWASDNRPGLVCRRGGKPGIGAIVVGLEKHGLAPITALGNTVGQARHHNARVPGHACASFGRLRDIHSGAAQSRKLSP
jgi:hypothetical protein